MYLVHITPEMDLDHGFRSKPDTFFLFDKRENAESFMALSIMTYITKNHTMFFHEAADEWGYSTDKFSKLIDRDVKNGIFYGLTDYSIRLLEINKYD